MIEGSGPAQEHESPSCSSRSPSIVEQGFVSVSACSHFPVSYPIQPIPIELEHMNTSSPRLVHSDAANDDWIDIPSSNRSSNLEVTPLENLPSPVEAEGSMDYSRHAFDSYFFWPCNNSHIAKTTPLNRNHVRHSWIHLRRHNRLFSQLLALVSRLMFCRLRHCCPS